MKGHIKLSGEAVETVRVRLHRWVGRPDTNGHNRLEVADTVGRGRDSIDKFLSGSNPSSSLAMDLIMAIPELGVSILCPCCGRPMPGAEIEE